MSRSLRVLACLTIIACLAYRVVVYVLAWLRASRAVDSAPIVLEVPPAEPADLDAWRATHARAAQLILWPEPEPATLLPFPLRPHDFALCPSREWRFVSRRVNGRAGADLCEGCGEEFYNEGLTTDDGAQWCACCLVARRNGNGATGSAAPFR